jgi:hypothetical protein
MILTSPDQWGHEALKEILAYKGTEADLDHVDIAGP